MISECDETMEGPVSDSADAPLSCGIEFLTDFWKEKYLQEYIKNGVARLNLSPDGHAMVKPIFSG
jgi:hypothetical protein